MSYEARVIHENDFEQPSGMRFATEAEAQQYANAVVQRVTSGHLPTARLVKIVRTKEPANYHWVDGEPALIE